MEEESKSEAKVEEKREFKKNSDFTNKLRENPWMVSTFVFAIASIVLLILALSPSGGLTGNVISEQDAIQETTDFVSRVYGVELTYQNSTQDGDVYDMTFDLEGRPVELAVMKDFSFLMLPSGGWVRTADLADVQAQPQAQQQQQQAEPQEVTKSDKPTVELFIMTHCPFGTQAEKGIIPAVEALGNDIDFKVRFVHYFMHGDEEEEESMRQLCIREEQPTKYMNYLKCFLEAGDSAGCMSKNGVNAASVSSCMENKAADYYAADSALSQSYGVQGSPTLVINGGQADYYPRSPANALSVICSAFNTPSDACSEQLSTTGASAGFGYGEDAGTTAASCG
ncbi:MAG: hypothetical protein ABIE22_04605 [archaeon]